MAASLKDPGSIPGGGPKRFHDSFNFVFYIVGECISCAADTHLATDLTCMCLCTVQTDHPLPAPIHRSVARLINIYFNDEDEQRVMWALARCCTWSQTGWLLSTRRPTFSSTASLAPSSDRSSSYHCHMERKRFNVIYYLCLKEIN